MSLTVKKTARIINWTILLVMAYHILLLTGILDNYGSWAQIFEQNSDMVMGIFGVLILLLFAIMIASMRAGMMNRIVAIGTVKFFLWFFSIVFLLAAVYHIFMIPSITGIAGTATFLIVAILFSRLATDKNKFPRAK